MMAMNTRANDAAMDAFVIWHSLPSSLRNGILSGSVVAIALNYLAGYKQRHDNSVQQGEYNNA